jgi:hypothetical protein
VRSGRHASCRIGECRGALGSLGKVKVFFAFVRIS